MTEIRAMKQSEATKVRKLGRRSFEWFESLFIPKPKDCYIAVEENEIIGAVLYKNLTIFIMVISIIPFYPLASFGGKRIFELNKWLFIIVVTFSLYIVFLN